MRCEYCDGLIDENSKFCQHCGKKIKIKEAIRYELQVFTQSQGENSRPSESQVYMPVKAKSKGLGIQIIFIGTVLFFIGFLLWESSSENNIGNREAIATVASTSESEESSYARFLNDYYYTVMRSTEDFIKDALPDLEEINFYHNKQSHNASNVFFSLKGEIGYSDSDGNIIREPYDSVIVLGESEWVGCYLKIGDTVYHDYLEYIDSDGNDLQTSKPAVEGAVNISKQLGLHSSASTSSQDKVNQNSATNVQEDSSDGGKMMARYYAKEMVKESLNYPKTAKFGWQLQYAVDEEYRGVSGTVTAENAFGVESEYNFYAQLILKADPNDGYYPIILTMNDELIYDYSDYIDKYGNITDEGAKAFEELY